MLDYEIKNLKRFEKILGMDEAGRGALAGPLVVAGVIFPANYKNDEINDSKKLTSKQRENLFFKIQEDAIAYEIIELSNFEVDELNPKKASIVGMEKIANLLADKYDVVITDFEKLNLQDKKQINLVKGDTISISVAAASILAKHYRDQVMRKLHLKYPMFSWDKNKGYGTKLHLEGLRKNGVSPFHRLSYKPVKQAIMENNAIK
ncbi:ribonuclease HII [Mycoplasma crocodyli]|uniref:Ribonuclease n=1 Tax=Mycoplasma crocodyli (strain ATCC 51981 / MP145) TaxID=512564 RepID=D5E695_MYCCM|nr:ribonuclease HII [Mycoplasma crocodyli]ADE19425.1 ribonuclease HII [Mycoplasma crocodyli MP145]